jgi:hypothetical protein
MAGTLEKLHKLLGGGEVALTDTAIPRLGHDASPLVRFDIKTQPVEASLIEKLARVNSNLDVELKKGAETTWRVAFAWWISIA